MSCPLSESATRILGVHGVGNFQDGCSPAEASARIAGWWRGALGALPAGAIDLQVNYYAHLLAGPSTQGDGDLGHLGDGATAAIVEWACQLGAYQDVAQGRLTQPARTGVGWVARRFGLDHKLVTQFVAAFFPEVITYFTDPQAHHQAVAALATQIGIWRPRVLIAHSLGSVVAYEALWSDPELEVELLLTLGSPLAMPTIVYDRLAEHPGPRRRPPGVRRWINIADRGDIIAIPPGGVNRGFQGLGADLSDSVHAFDFHRVTNYLSCPTTTAALAALV
jgi:hypothetical protein